MAALYSFASLVAHVWRVGDLTGFHVRTYGHGLIFCGDDRMTTMLLRRYRLLTLLVLLLVCCGLRAEQVAKLPAPSNYVSDFAHVLSPQVTDQTNALCLQLQQRAKAQLFVVTIKSLEDEPIEQFANDLFHKWGIGDKATNRGILLLLVTEDHRGRIEVGLGLEGVVTDSIVGPHWPRAASGDPVERLQHGGDQRQPGACGADCGGCQGDAGQYASSCRRSRCGNRHRRRARIIGWLVVFAIFLLISRVFGGRGGRGGYYGGYWGGGGVGWRRRLGRRWWRWRIQRRRWRRFGRWRSVVLEAGIQIDSA